LSIFDPPQHLLRPFTSNRALVLTLVLRTVWKRSVWVILLEYSKDLLPIKRLSEAEEAFGGNVGVDESGNMEERVILGGNEVLYGIDGRLIDEIGIVMGGRWNVLLRFPSRLTAAKRRQDLRGVTTFFKCSKFSPVNAALAHPIVDGVPCFSGTSTFEKLQFGSYTHHQSPIHHIISRQNKHLPPR
jgi:hypothetical protein